eukprot:5630276-Pleurochrysis_carterae.AAC.1
MCKIFSRALGRYLSSTKEEELNGMSSDCVSLGRLWGFERGSERGGGFQHTCRDKSVTGHQAQTHGRLQPTVVVGATHSPFPRVQIPGSSRFEGSAKSVGLSPRATLRAYVRRCAACVVCAAA